MEKDALCFANGARWTSPGTVWAIGEQFVRLPLGFAAMVSRIRRNREPKSMPDQVGES
jgi:hypothetical protein